MCCSELPCAAAHVMPDLRRSGRGWCGLIGGSRGGEEKGSGAEPTAVLSRSAQHSSAPNCAKPAYWPKQNSPGLGCVGPREKTGGTGAGKAAGKEEELSQRHNCRTNRRMDGRTNQQTGGLDLDLDRDRQGSLLLAAAPGSGCWADDWRQPSRRRRTATSDHDGQNAIRCGSTQNGRVGRVIAS